MDQPGMLVTMPSFAWRWQVRHQTLTVWTGESTSTLYMQCAQIQVDFENRDCTQWWECHSGGSVLPRESLRREVNRNWNIVVEYTDHGGLGPELEASASSTIHIQSLKEDMNLWDHQCHRVWHTFTRGTSTESVRPIKRKKDGLDLHYSTTWPLARIDHVNGYKRKVDLEGI